MTTSLLLPEELLLLMYDDDSGKPMLDSSRRPAAVAGAAVLDLVLDGNLVIVEEDGLFGTKRVLRATDAPGPEHPLMQKVIDASEGKKPKDAVGAVAGMTSFSNLADKLTKSLLHDMAEAGLLRAEHHGLFSGERFPAADGSAEASIRGRLEAILDGTEAPDPRSAGLIAVLRACKALHKAFPNRNRRELERQGAAIAEGDWAGTAVKDAIGEMEAVMITIMASTTLAATTTAIH